MVDRQLLVSRSDAEEMLNRQLAAGRELLAIADSVASDADYEEWDQARHRWVKLTEEAIRAAFGEGDLLDEFAAGARPALVLQATTAQQFRYRREAVSDALNTLISLLERLDFFSAPGAESGERAQPPDLAESHVFVVHGRDDALRERTARMLERTGEHDITILHEQPNQGRTLLEKFEEHAAEVGYAVVLLTADDKGGLADAEELRPRARQNVVFELGFFVGAIGRTRVAVLHEAGVELPSDIAGLVYIQVDDAGRWELELLRELRSAGLSFDLNKLA